MSMPLLPHRTLLNNLRQTETLVAIEHDEGLEKGYIVELIFDVADRGNDEIVLSHDHVVLLADYSIRWRFVRRIWTPAWTPTPPVTNYEPAPVNPELAEIHQRLADKRAAELKSLRDRVRALRTEVTICESSTSFSRCADGELCWVPAHKEAARKLADFARSQRNL